MEILMHGHHVGLLSVMPLALRLEEIETKKPKREQAIRKRLIQSVPLADLPPAIVEAAKPLAEAEADKAWDKATAQEWNNFDAVCSRHKVELEALHKKLCVPDCPWDGQQIVGIGD